VLVCVLGAVELAASGGTIVTLPGTRQSALLAALAARAGEVVSTDRLITLLWGDELPANPEASLHSTVFKLRNSLRSACGRDVLLTRARGYQLSLAPLDLDAGVFDDLLAQAVDQPPEEAAATLGRALGLWRGPAYGSFADTEIAHLEAMRLEEGRWTAVERRAEALLYCGRPAEVVRLLEPFVAEHPLRETARATLMRALHQTGRTAEALEQCQSYRHHLAEELGLEPSPLIQAIQAELLREPAAEATPTPSQKSVVPPQPRGLPGLHVKYLRGRSGTVIAYGSTGTGPRWS
jgi:DNA-binding SARP family transcriptional activator